jgi:hypothetical protein
VTDNKQPHFVAAMPGYWRLELVHSHTLDGNFTVHRKPIVAWEMRPGVDVPNINYFVHPVTVVWSSHRDAEERWRERRAWPTRNGSRRCGHDPRRHRGQVAAKQAAVGDRRRVSSNFSRDYNIESLNVDPRHLIAHDQRPSRIRPKGAGFEDRHAHALVGLVTSPRAWLRIAGSNRTEPRSCWAQQPRQRQPARSCCSLRRAIVHI